MIPPSNGSPMMPPPPWYDEVIDLTLDEARGLYEMGVKVYMDYASAQDVWYGRPFKMTARCAAEIGFSEFYPYTMLYYIPKGQDHDSSH